MAKRHLKRISAPRTWGIERKKTTFIVRPNPGAHPFEHGMPLGVFMREVFGLAQTSRETRSILREKSVLVDGKKRTDEHFLVGLFDVLDFKDLGQQHRIIITPKGKIGTVPAGKEDAQLKPCKITGKANVNGKVQINLSDGRNILVEKDSYRTGDTLLIELPGQGIKKHFPLDKKALIFLTGGKHIGQTGTVEAITGNRLMYRADDGSVVETHRKYAFVLGQEKPSISIAADKPASKAKAKKT